MDVKQAVKTLQVELTEQDVQNLQVSVLQMAKSSQADAQAMKVLMILHDKLENSVKKAAQERVSKKVNDFASKEFQEAASDMHKNSMAAKQDAADGCCGGGNCHP